MLWRCADLVAVISIMCVYSVFILSICTEQLVKGLKLTPLSAAYFCSSSFRSFCWELFPVLAKKPFDQLKPARDESVRAVKLLFSHLLRPGEMLLQLCGCEMTQSKEFGKN